MGVFDTFRAISHAKQMAESSEKPNGLVRQTFYGFGYQVQSCATVRKTRAS